MCHKSEIADKHVPVDNFGELYKVGDRVRARILKVCLVCRLHCDTYLYVSLLIFMHVSPVKALCKKNISDAIVLLEVFLL